MIDRYHPELRQKVQTALRDFWERQQERERRRREMQRLYRESALPLRMVRRREMRRAA